MVNPVIRVKPGFIQRKILFKMLGNYYHFSLADVSHLNNYGRVSKRYLTFDHINLITPWSAFAVILTRCRLSILVKRLCRCSTGCTPAAMLNSKHAVTCSYSRCSTLCNGIRSSPICSIQKGTLSFQGLNCSTWPVPEASNGFIS